MGRLEDGSISLVDHLLANLDGSQYDPDAIREAVEAVDPKRRKRLLAVFTTEPGVLKSEFDLDLTLKDGQWPPGMMDMLIRISSMSSPPTD